MAPFMIVISVNGLIFRDNSRKIFYLPIGLMGIVIILEKGISRQLDLPTLLNMRAHGDSATIPKTVDGRMTLNLCR
ncbi:MAG: hypothetical protein VXW22_12410 [Pseudomonadota bacterium]|nr:hypothetical protein [Pseudomonadota bacterium]